MQNAQQFAIILLEKLEQGIMERGGFKVIIIQIYVIFRFNYNLDID